LRNSLDVELAIHLLKRSCGQRPQLRAQSRHPEPLQPAQYRRSLRQWFISSTPLPFRATADSCRAAPTSAFRLLPAGVVRGRAGLVAVVDGVISVLKSLLNSPPSVWRSVVQRDARFLRVDDLDARLEMIPRHCFSASALIRAINHRPAGPGGASTRNAAANAPSEGVHSQFRS
jgi:hypothetical protein